MGTTDQPQLTPAGRPKRTHRLPLRYVNNVCLSLIGRHESAHACFPRTARACVPLYFAASEAYDTDISPLCCCTVCCKSCANCVCCNIPKRPRNGAPDKDGWRLVGAGRGMLPVPDVTVSAGRSVPTALPLATSDRPEPTPGVADALAGQSTPLALPMVVDDCPAPASEEMRSAERSSMIALCGQPLRRPGGR